MKKTLITTAILFLIILNFLIINPAFADKISFPYWGPIMSCNTKLIEYGRYADPCSSLCDLLSTGQRAIYLLITIALFVLAPIFFIIGAFLMIISRGNQKQLEQGKNIFTNTIWGVVIVLTAFIIVNTVFVILGPKISSGTYSWSEIKCPADLPGTIKWVY
jgi:uncharacterized membrane protein